MPNKSQDPLFESARSGSTLGSGGSGAYYVNHCILVAAPGHQALVACGGHVIVDMAPLLLATADSMGAGPKATVSGLLNLL